MRRSDSTRLSLIALACLAGSVSSGCFQTYVQAVTEPCPPMTEELLMYLLDADNLAADYVSDETIPYCEGLKAVNR